MFHLVTRVTCEQCGLCVTVNTGDELEAGRLIARRKWRFIDWGYGNESHVCGEACEKSYRERMKATGIEPNNPNPEARDE